MPLAFNKLRPPSSDSLLGRIAVRLNELGCHVRHFWISTYADELILHGRVSTYYAKQVAQTVAMEISDRTILSNEIEVD